MCVALRDKSFDPPTLILMAEVNVIVRQYTEQGNPYIFLSCSFKLFFKNRQVLPLYNSYTMHTQQTNTCIYVYIIFGTETDAIH